MLDKLFFKKKRDEQISELFQELRDAWKRIQDLEEAVKSYQDIDEKTVQYQQKKATEYRNRAAHQLEKITETRQQIDAVKIYIDQVLTLTVEHKSVAASAEESVKALSEVAASRAALLKEQLDAYNEFETNHPNFASEIERFEGIKAGSESLYTKISQILKNAETRRKEILEKHQQVFGFNQEDDNGEVTQQPGLVDELEESYNELAANIKLSKETLSFAVTNAKAKAKEAQITLEEGAENQLDIRKQEFEATQKRIESLLPGALAAGLADAYAKKVKDEVEERDEHRREFASGIRIMLCIALIPLIVSLVFLAQGTTLQEVIERLPKIALATAFLYGAAIWKTAAAGKRQRLSKRLIEEYSHKEAQSRTFVGLSQQISDLGDDALSEDLKLKLLYNLVQISSENPGKLISDYRKSDHPIYELSEQGAKLATAIEKVKRIPGGDMIAQVLAGTRKRLVDTADTRAREGIAAATSTGETEDTKTVTV